MTTAQREFGLSLRRRRDDRRLTQSRIADELGVQRATLSQWETGRHLPSPDNVVHLDGLLSAGGELVALAEDARRTDDTDTRAETVRVPLHEVYGRLGRALVDRVIRDPDGRPLGWSHDFLPGLPPTPLTTASGIRLLTDVEAPYVDRHALGRSVMKRREEGGGWGARRMRARPEATAVVLDALTRIGTELDIDAELAVLARLLAGAEPNGTYVLSTVLATVTRLRPGGEFATTLTRRLLGLRRTARDGVAWPEKGSVAASVPPRLSTAHTARAVIALAAVRDAGHARDEVSDALGRASQWLQEHALVHPIRENLDAIDKSGMVGDLEIRHMTPALLASALALGPAPDWGRIQEAVDALWTYYDPTLGLWFWPNGDLPLWLQTEAVAAVRRSSEMTTSVALPPRPQPEP